jgi:hypothetical protein
MIKRILQDKLQSQLGSSKAIVVMGARQVGKLHAYEFKWNEHKSKVKCPLSFSNAYPDAAFSVITPQNIDEFILNHS